MEKHTDNEEIIEPSFLSDFLDHPENDEMYVWKEKRSELRERIKSFRQSEDYL